MIAEVQRPSSVVIVLSSLGGLSVLAHAAPPQITLSAASGYTDNALAVENENDSGAGVQNDFFASVAPRISFFHETRRFMSYITLLGSFRHYFTQTGGDSLEGGAIWSATYEVSPTWRLSTDLSATVASNSAVQPTDIVGAIPVGTKTYLQTNGNLTLFKDFSPFWRGTDTLGVSGYVPFEDKNDPSLSFSNALSVQGSLERDAFGLTLGTTYSRYAAASTPTTQSKTFVTSYLTWLHELSPYWQFTANAGAAVAFEDSLRVAPVGSAVLLYRRDRTDLSLSIDESIESNTLVGLSYLTSSATLGASLRFFDRLSVHVSGGASHGEALAINQTVDVLRGDASISWLIVDNFTIDAAYSFVFQRTMDETLGYTPHLIRNQVLLSLTTYFPNDRTPPLNLGTTLRVRASEERDRQTADAPRRP